MNTRAKTITISVTTAALLAAGCTSSTTSGTSAAPHGNSATSAPAPDASPAANLRATLTALLSDHVWLAGNALQTAVLNGGNLKAPAVAGAVAALDANSVALAQTLGSLYPDAEKPFLASWRQHIGFFVNYTLGKATKDAAMVSKARSDLDGYRTSFGQLINSVIPELPADAVAKELIPHVQTLFDAIDAAVAGGPNFQTKLATAAEHMVMTAAILTGGIVANKKITS
jgi:hypothetical protein